MEKEMIHVPLTVHRNQNAFYRILIEYILKEIEPLQHISLLDIG